MRARRWGRVIFMTSFAAKQPQPDLLLSNTARAGLLGFAKTMANEMAAEGVLVNTVLPGHFDTARAAELARRLPPFVTPVLLFVNEAESKVVASCGHLALGIIQFHGDETAQQCLDATGAGARAYLRARAKGGICRIGYAVCGVAADRAALLHQHDATRARAGCPTYSH
jgi:hypothetical protein